MRKLLLQLTLILVSLHAFGQYTTVNLPFPSGACLGSTYQVSVNFNGLSSGTLAHIVLSDDNFVTQDTLGTATKAASNLVSVSVTIPSSLTLGTNFRFKGLVAGVNSIPSTTFAVIENNSTVAMSGSYVLDLCTGFVNIPLTFGGDFPITVTFQKDSETPSNTTYYSYSSPIRQVYDSGVYQITSVSNTCGTGVVAASPNNQATITDPAYTFDISHLGDSILCEGESFKVFFNNSFNCTTENFTVQYSEIGQSAWSNMVSNDDSSSLGYIIGTTPVSFANETKNFKLRLRLQVGGGTYYTDEYNAIQVINRPSMEFGELLGSYYAPGSSEFDLVKGEVQIASFELTGTAPWEINLDGHIFKKDTANFTFDFSPEETRTYHFLSVRDSTGCINAGVDVTFNVFDNIFQHRILGNRNLDNSSFWRNYCNNDPLVVDYHIRGKIPPSGFFTQIGLESDEDSWQNVGYFTNTNSDQLELIIPSGLPIGKYQFRMVPMDNALSFKNNSLTYINDYIKPNSTFIVMDYPETNFAGPAISQIYPSDDFYLPLQFSGGPAYYDGFLPISVYKPLIKTENDTIRFGYNGISGFNRLISTVLIDTLTADNVFTILSTEANKPAGSYDCAFPAVHPPFKPGASGILSMEVNVIDPVPGFSITTSTVSSASNLCAGATITIPFSSTGSFNAGNAFKVQLKEYSSTFSSGIVLSNFFDAEVISFTASSVTIRMPIITNRKPDFYYRVRVVSTDPVVLGSASSSWLYVTRTVPKVDISGQAYVQPGENAEVFVSTVSDPFFTFNLTNGLSNSSILYSYNYSTEKQLASFTVPSSSSVGSTINLTTTALSNACGAGVSSSSGQIHVVGSNQLTLTGPVISTFCQNATFKVQITNAQIINSDNFYEANVTRTSSGQAIAGAKISNLGAGWFEVSVPYQGIAGAFRLTVNSTSPFMRSNTYDFTLHTRPTAQTSVVPILVEKGDTATISYNLQGGTAPYQITLNTDQRIVNETINGNTFDYKIRPMVSTTYKVIALTDANGCSKELTANTFKTVQVISNKAAVEIVNVEANSFCSGAQIKVNYRVDVTPDNLFLQMSDQNGENFLTIPSTIHPDSILFNIPTISTGDNYQLSLRLIKDGIIYNSLPVLLPYFQVSGGLSGVMSGETDIVFDTDPLYFTGDESFLAVDFMGLPPYNVRISNGKDTTDYFTNSNPLLINVQPDSTRNYVIQHLNNRCETGTSSGNSDFDVYHLNIADVLNPYFCSEIPNKAAYSSEGDYGVPTEQTGPYLQLLSLDPARQYESFNSKIYTIPITWSADSVLFVLPPSIPVSINSSQLYRVRLISSNPKIDGDWSETLVRVSESNPVFTILGSTNVNAGTSTPITIKTDKDVVGYGYLVGPGGQNLFTFSKEGSTIMKTVNTTSTFSLGDTYPACGTASIGDPATAIITVGPCPPNQQMSLDIAPPTNRTFETSGGIEAINTIGAGTNIIYDAQSSILLKPGFQVLSGAIFRAIIDGCD